MNQRVKDFIRTNAAAALHGAGITALRRSQQARDPRITILTCHGISGP